MNRIHILCCFVLGACSGQSLSRVADDDLSPRKEFSKLAREETTYAGSITGIAGSTLPIRFSTATTNFEYNTYEKSDFSYISSHFRGFAIFEIDVLKMVGLSSVSHCNRIELYEEGEGCDPQKTPTQTFFDLKGTSYNALINDKPAEVSAINSLIDSTARQLGFDKQYKVTSLVFSAEKLKGSVLKGKLFAYYVVWNADRTSGQSKYEVVGTFELRNSAPITDMIHLDDNKFRFDRYEFAVIHSANSTSFQSRILDK